MMTRARRLLLLLAVRLGVACIRCGRFQPHRPHDLCDPCLRRLLRAPLHMDDVLRAHGADL